MQKLLHNGYAEEVPNQELSRCDGKVFYLPHHAVFHPQKPEKLRIVFDCAAVHNDTGISLNMNVLQGPDLTNSLIGTLLRFREREIVIMADIEEFFLMVRVTPDHRDVLRFLWWPNA